MPRILCSKNGPYLVSGGVALLRRTAGQDESGEALARREHYALCRCGHSRMKPYCDYKHLATRFDGGETAGLADASADAAAPESAAPAIVFQGDPREPSDGPFLLFGDIAVVSADGGTYDTTRRRALCRCGRSADKPFCDGAHALPD